MNKTTKHQYRVSRQTHKIDATGAAVGRLASQVARLLMGKNKASFSPQTDCGDIVEISHADKLVWTGNKLKQRLFYHYSGYGLKSKKLAEVFAKDPTAVIRKSVRAMLPNNHLRAKILKRIKFV